MTKTAAVQEQMSRQASVVRNVVKIDDPDYPYMLAPQLDWVSGKSATDGLKAHAITVAAEINYHPISDLSGVAQFST